MQIDIIKVGALEANCYVLTLNDNTIIIDPGDEAEKIMKYIKGNVKAILVTHNHFDHIGAVLELKNKYNCQVYSYSNLKEDSYNISGFKFKVIYTKGHTDDSITYYFDNDNIMFTGDFLFKGTIGRTDLETGNLYEMQKSLNKIKKYSQSIKIYPGHGDMTILGFEINKNPFFSVNIV